MFITTLYFSLLTYMTTTNKNIFITTSCSKYKRDNYNCYSCKPRSYKITNIYQSRVI